MGFFLLRFFFALSFVDIRHSSFVILLGVFESLVFWAQQAAFGLWVGGDESFAFCRHSIF